MKKIAILQSNYIPWKGYFDMIAAVDQFILYDDAQYTVNDWRNRNKLKTPHGLQWLTVPVLTKGRFGQRIVDAEIKQSNWAEVHWKTICQNYRRASHFATLAPAIEEMLVGTQHKFLSSLNRSMIEFVCNSLGIRTIISSTSDYRLIEGKTERLVDLCRQAGATEYVSGPAARCYLDEAQFAENGIRVTWFDYAGYPEHPQLWGAFRHDVSILDLLLNCGEQASRYMRFVRP
ncbi:MAG TPA: WbqC family protein [Rhodocyclaceae bacterium]